MNYVNYLSQSGSQSVTSFSVTQVTVIPPFSQEVIFLGRLDVPCLISKELLRYGGVIISQ
jgi:hypothetical protein